MRWFAKYAAKDRYLLLRDARELIDLLEGVGDQVAVVRLERCLPPPSRLMRTGGRARRE